MGRTKQIRQCNRSTDKELGLFEYGDVEEATSSEYDSDDLLFSDVQKRSKKAKRKRAEKTEPFSVYQKENLPKRTRTKRTRTKSNDKNDSCIAHLMDRSNAQNPSETKNLKTLKKKGSSTKSGNEVSDTESISSRTRLSQSTVNSSNISQSRNASESLLPSDVPSPCQISTPARRIQPSRTRQRTLTNASENLLSPISSTSETSVPSSTKENESPTRDNESPTKKIFHTPGSTRRSYDRESLSAVKRKWTNAGFRHDHKDDDGEHVSEASEGEEIFDDPEPKKKKSKKQIQIAEMEKKRDSWIAQLNAEFSDIEQHELLVESD